MGIKRRLEEAVASSESASAAGGAAGDASESVSSIGSRGIRKRLGSTTEPVSVSKHDAPYTEYVKQQWGKGKLSSAQVQEHAFKAAQQGAAGLESLGAAGG